MLVFAPPSYERLASCPNSRNLNPPLEPAVVLDTPAASPPRRDMTAVAAEAVGAILLAGCCTTVVYLAVRRMGLVDVSQGKLCCCQLHPTIRRLLGIRMMAPHSSSTAALDNRRFAVLDEDGEDGRYVHGGATTVQDFAPYTPTTNPFAANPTSAPVAGNPLFETAPVAIMDVEGGAATVELSIIDTTTPVGHDATPAVGQLRL